jgi:hypothetical protein
MRFVSEWQSLAEACAEMAKQACLEVTLKIATKVFGELGLSALFHTTK